MDESCTVYQAADFIGKRWTALILLELYKGKSNTRRYSELKKHIPGITPKMLSMRLRELEHERLVKKTVDASEFPVKSSYSLTKSGSDFIKIIKALKTWTLTWKLDNKLCKNAECGKCPADKL
jgi:DNA-binding HxlR family transcriptional regulator